MPALRARRARFEMDSVVRTSGAAYQEPGLRSLDAIHLATASVAASTAALCAFVTYDSRLAETADALGMPTLAPGLD